MSRINEKMGLPPGGKRNTDLPKDRALRIRITAARCPTCSRTGAKYLRHRTPGIWVFCSWCSDAWELAPALVTTTDTTTDDDDTKTQARSDGECSSDGQDPREVRDEVD